MVTSHSHTGHSVVHCRASVVRFPRTRLRCGLAEARAPIPVAGVRGCQGKGRKTAGLWGMAVVSVEGGSANRGPKCTVPDPMNRDAPHR